MSEEKKMIINEKDFVACNYFEACDYFKNMKRLQEENEELKKYQYTQEYLQSEIEKRQKALEEIREIAKEITNKQIFKNNVYENLDTKGKRILDKINEVFGNE